MNTSETNERGAGVDAATATRTRATPDDPPREAATPAFADAREKVRALLAKGT
jgi:hypothetical protein